MHILITSFPKDMHAATVTLALRDKGHKVTLVDGQDFPLRQSITLKAGPDLEPDLAVQTCGHQVTLDDIDTVWHRRPSLFGSLESLHPDDMEFAKGECKYFSRSVWQLVGLQSFWVNPLGSASRTNKLAQLIVARKIGLQIPQTLMSNDPDEIRSFVRTSPNGAIYKSFRSFHWEEPDRRHHLLYTSEVDLQHLDDGQALRLVPGIYQEKLSKAYEIRATFMGATCLAVAIDSQSLVTSQIDSRGVGLERPHLSYTLLPKHIYSACRHLMQHFGIVFGCFDFVVTPDGNYIFLEVNEAGQFLYLEEEVSELPVLDAFCEFLVSQDPNFKYSPSADAIAGSRYFQDERLVRHMAALAVADFVPPRLTAESPPVG